MDQTELSREFNRRIAQKREERFTGRLTLTVEVHMSQGGLTAAVIDRTASDVWRGGEVKRNAA